MNIQEILHKALMAGVGIPEKIGELVHDLVQKGELSESQGAKLVKECEDKLGKSAEEMNGSVSQIVSVALEKMNIPSRDEVDELKSKIKALSSRVKKLEGTSRDS